MNQKKECMDVHVNGLKFHVQTFGSGVPVIMIMGLGAPGDKWKHNYELLSRWFWCIVPDNRGIQQSRWQMILSVLWMH